MFRHRGKWLLSHRNEIFHFHKKRSKSLLLISSRLYEITSPDFNTESLIPFVIPLRTDSFLIAKTFFNLLFYFNSKWLDKNLMIIKKTIFLSFKQNGNLQVTHSMLDRKSASLVLQ